VCHTIQAAETRERTFATIGSGQNRCIPYMVLIEILWYSISMLTGPWTKLSLQGDGLKVIRARRPLAPPTDRQR
jgi:hypothetical protein